MIDTCSGVCGGTLMEMGHRRIERRCIEPGIVLRPDMYIFGGKMMKYRERETYAGDWSWNQRWVRDFAIALPSFDRWW